MTDRSEAVRMTMHSYPIYNFRFQLLRQKMFRPITLQPSVAIATCRKTSFPKIVLLRYKAKPYLGFQNLGCHCKILGCHFGTQKRPKKHWVGQWPRHAPVLRRPWLLTLIELGCFSWFTTIPVLHWTKFPLMPWSTCVERLKGHCDRPLHRNCCTVSKSG